MENSSPFENINDFVQSINTVWQIEKKKVIHAQELQTHYNQQQEMIQLKDWDFVLFRTAHLTNEEKAH